MVNKAVWASIASDRKTEMGLDFVHDQKSLSRELSGKIGMVEHNLFDNSDWGNSNINMAHGRSHDQPDKSPRTRHGVGHGDKPNSGNKDGRSFSRESKLANVNCDTEPGGNRADANTDLDESVKMSVRERVQLLNSQSVPGNDRSRGRSSATRGWMKKRDQSAPPGGSRNRFPQESVTAGGGPTRRSRSTERRPRNIISQDSSSEKDKDLTSRQELRPNRSPSEEHTDIKISKNSAFIRVGRPRSQLGTKTSLPETPLKVSSKVPSQEPHFNPRSRMRNRRTVRNFAKGTPESGLEAEGSPRVHAAPCSVGSPLQREKTLESASASSLNKQNFDSEKVETQANVSVKRMVSFIRKGGLTDPSVTRPTQITDRESPLHGESGLGTKLSCSRSQTDILPSSTSAKRVNVGNSGGKAWLDSEGRNRLNESLTSEMTQRGKSPRSAESGTERSLQPLHRTIPGEQIVEASMGILTETEAERDLREDVKTGKVVHGLPRTSNNPQFSDLTRRDTFKSNQSTSLGPWQQCDEPALGPEKRHAFNLHYKSDSSSSSEEIPKPSVQPITNFSDDPEWDAIVAKSKAFDQSRGNPYNRPNMTGGKDPVSDTITDVGHRSLVKVPSRSTPRESENDDVFEKSMHPLDFALAIRDITEPARSSERSRDRSFGSSPRDAGSFSRGLQTSNVTDVDGKDVVENSKLDVGNRTDFLDIMGDSKQQRTPGRGRKPRLLERIENRSLGSSQRLGSPMEYVLPHKETYSGLTTINVKSDGSGSRVEDVASSPHISVEVDVDQDADYVRIDQTYRLPVDIRSANGQSEPRSRPSSTNPNHSRHKARSQIDVKPPPFDPQTPKASAASPEVRRHRMRGGGHRRMPSKSSMASTGSVSYHQSSQGSSSNGGHQRPRSGRQGSNLSPMLSGRRVVPPPNDITVADPHSSVDSSHPPRSRTHSRSKSQRSNSEVSKSSSSSHSQLNHFFDMMGLDSSVLSSLRQPRPLAEEAVFQDMHTLRVGASTSSSHTTGSLSEGSRVSAEGVMNMKKLTKLPDQSQSIVTKNARVIKWLVQCKKSQAVACR